MVKTGIISVDVILEMNLVMMLITFLARAGAIYIVLVFLPNMWGDWLKALVISILIQIYMVGSVFLHRIN
jgi:hypothetical protein